MAPAQDGPDVEDADDDLAREEPGEEGDLRVGDVTVIPYAEVRAQLGCEAEAGILLEDRRSVVKVFFPGMDRTFWLERERVRSVPADRLPLHPLVDRLHRISRRVGAELIEYYDQKGPETVFHVYCGAMDLEGLQAVVEEMGAAMPRFRVEPGSTRRLKLNLALLGGTEAGQIPPHR
jgi:hypothetical protein